jgi:hypothetical protein
MRQTVFGALCGIRASLTPFLSLSTPCHHRLWVQWYSALPKYSEPTGVQRELLDPLENRVRQSNRVANTAGCWCCCRRRQRCHQTPACQSLAAIRPSKSVFELTILPRSRPRSIFVSYQHCEAWSCQVRLPAQDAYPAMRRILQRPDLYYCVGTREICCVLGLG